MRESMAEQKTKTKQKQEDEGRSQYAKKLASRIMDYTRDQLIAAMPYFNRAILKMPVVFYRNGFKKMDRPEGFGTNGRRIFCDENQVISSFRKEEGLLPRTLLHMLLHCVFQHPFRYERLDSKFWDFAADIAVENVMLEMNWNFLGTKGDSERIRVIEELKLRAGRITAENLYHYFYLHPRETEALLRHSALFHRDVHKFWVPENMTDRPESLNKNIGLFDKNGEEWSRITQTTKMDMDTFETNKGEIPDVLTDNLLDVRRGTYDYSTFLRKFLAWNEEIHVNPDEFDYIYYLYGMHLYENMPLIEPLEYRDTHKIRDFVIAIDTSGSTMGRTVRNFLSQTASVLTGSGNFFARCRVHVIECDSKIQKDDLLTSPEDFDRYLKNIELKGGGGTDFRPVFRYIDRLQKEEKMNEVQGLLYFTDGLGTFPKTMPRYKTAFVFLKTHQQIKNVPPWAIRLDIAEEDLASSDEDYIDETLVQSMDF
jgi:predicted metal-dependent peptidase